MIKQERPGVAAPPGVRVIQVWNIAFLSSRKCRFGAFGELGESLRIFNRDLCKDPAVQGDICLFKAADKSAIGDVVASGGGT